MQMSKEGEEKEKGGGRTLLDRFVSSSLIMRIDNVFDILFGLHVKKAQF